VLAEDKKAFSTAPSVSSQLKKVVMSCMVGNALEWYDFALYGYFAAIIGRMAFPSSGDVIGTLLKSYGVFFAGFVMRPLGALVFGHIGDRHGRKRALMLSIYCMAIPTTLIGLLPTYAQVGVWAPIFLTVLRLFQGLSMGGEFTGSMLFIVEHAPKGQKGFWGSYSSFSVIIGLIIGSGISALISFLVSAEQLEAWGWRIPFLLSSVGSVIGAYMRRTLADPHEFTTHQQSSDPQESSRSRFVIKDLFSHYRSTIFKVVCVDLTVAVGFFLICVYIMTYLQNFVGFSYRFAVTVNTLSMLVFAAVIPIAGRASDRWSPVQVMKAAVIGFIFLSIPLFYGLSSGTPVTAAISQIGLSVLMGINFAPISVLLVSLFPVHVRYSGVSIAHNLSMAIFGGSAPHVVTFLIKNTGNLLMPGIILTLAALGSLWGLSSVRPSKDF